MRRFLILFLLSPVLLAGLTLQEAEEGALDQNKGVRISKEAELEARYRRRIARGRWLPQASVTADASRTATAGDMGYKTFYASRLRFSQSLYDPNIYSAIRIRGVEYRQGQNREVGFRNDTLFQVRVAFYLVVLSDKAVEVERENIALLEEATEREKELWEAGEATSFDVNQSNSIVGIILEC